MQLQDGRTLEYMDNGVTGDSRKKAIIFHHGTPGSCTSWHSWLTMCAEMGIRALSYSRAGYGQSSRRKGRSVVDNNDDISELLSAKEISTFVSIGLSGGGPHSLVQTLDHRNVGAISLAGVGAYGVPDLDFMAGQGPENIEEWAAALAGEETLEKWMEANGSGLRTITAAGIIEALGGLIGAPDKAILTNDVAEDFAADFRHALSISYTGWMDDDFAFMRDWGIDLSAITKPVQLWQGDEDFMVPHAHGIWLKSKIPTATLNFVPGEGHLSLGIKKRREILDQAKALLA